MSINSSMDITTLEQSVFFFLIYTQKYDAVAQFERTHINLSNKM